MLSRHIVAPHPRPLRRTGEAVLPLEPRRLLSSTGPGLTPATPLPVVNQLVIVHGLVTPTPAMFRPAARPVAPARPAASSPTPSKASAPSSSSTSPAAATSAALSTVTPNSSPGSQSGALAGRVLFTSGGHGYVWRSSGYWGIMRSYLFNFMEDMGNQDQLEPYANYALASGATVVSMRPVGHQVNEVIVDNADAYNASTGGYQVVSGSWSNSTGAPYWSNHDGNDAVHYTFATSSLTETAVARFTPNITAAGIYPVYAWYNPGNNDVNNNRVSDQLFRINYAGGSYEVKVAANKVGNGWIYLGEYYFAAGVNPASGSVDISNESAVAGKAIIADAIRFGNGMGDVNYSYSYPNGTSNPPVQVTIPVSGYPREDECSLYWDYASRGWTAPGVRVAPSVVYAGTSTDDETKNFSACDNFAAYMNNEAVGVSTDRLWMSYHSNASSNGTARGTWGLITGSATANQAQLASLAAAQVGTELQAVTGNWGAYRTYTGGYGEISTSYIGNEFDATIIEVAFHDNATDVAMLKDPTVRGAVGRATYHAAIKYFQTYGGLTNTTFLPEPPVNVRTASDSAGNVTVSWTPGPSSTGTTGPYGNAAVSYKVYTSPNGYGFDGGVSTSSTSLTFSSLATSAPTYFRVTALNAGGESLGSYVVVAKPQAERTAPILVVNNFTRLDAAQDQVETKSFGTITRARQRYNNSFDYVVQAASAINAYNPALGIDSCSAASIANGQVSLSAYRAVIWMSGEQTYGNGTFTSQTQPLVTSYLNAGGKIFVSGSEVGYDLVGKGSGLLFFTQTLHAAYVSDDANTHSFTGGAAGSALAGVPAGTFDDGTHATYDVDAPDVLGISNGSTVAMSYSGGTGGASVVQYASPTTGTRTVMMGFPLESLYTPAARNAITAGVLGFFETPGTPVLSGGSDTGVSASDRITRLNNSGPSTLVFSVPNTFPGATVQLLADGNLIGSAVATGTTTTITTNGAFLLTDSVHTITARQQDAGWNLSPASVAITITVDTASPTVTLAAIGTPRGTSLSADTVTFSEPVSGVSLTDFTLSRDSSANLLTASQSVTGSNSTYALAGLDPVTGLAGTYALTLAAGGSGIVDTAGNPLVIDASATWVMNTINATAADDAIRLSADASNPAVLDVTLNGSTYTVNLAGLGTLNVSANGGTDALTVDLSTGQPAFDPGAGLSFAADSADTLALIGTAADDAASFAPTVATLGALTISYPATLGNVAFQGVTGNDTLTLSRSMVFPTDAAADTAHLTLDVAPGGAATFLASQHLAALHLADGALATLAAGGNKLLVTSDLSLAPTATLDLTDEDLVLDYSGPTPLDQIRAALASAYSAGTWTGYGITSSTAAADPQHLTAIADVEAADLALTQFDGQPVDSTSLLLKYTWQGDTDLDGRITPDDLARADLGALKHRTSWLWGDSNYDATVDPTDVSRTESSFALQSGVL